MKKTKICLIMAVLLILSTVTGCTKMKEEKPEDDYSINYLVLVNKLNPLPENWEKEIRTENFTNSVGMNVEVETKAYQAYLQLKQELENEGVYIDLDSARRSIEEQQQIMDEFSEEYGADYAAKVVAKPGYSEHHTGLALDLYLIVDGKDITLNEDLVQYPEIWQKIHEKMTKYGFILHYIDGKEHITGYAYEPWHLRYVDDPEIAKEIMDKGITLESYLGMVNETDPVIDLGTSAIYSEDELREMAILIKCTFAAWKDCELHSIRYAGDEASSEENLKWINSISTGTEYVKVAEFLMDFHSPKNNENSTLEADHEYTDYQWWLGCDAEGSWEIVSFGY
ncbi:MAG: M15 family metallopeptidase [Erysipelotrichaceae bacterium]|nr:M15 family metallopeptidase [Erysipelotrichaceae bacterium]